MYTTECTACGRRICVHPELSQVELCSAECVLCGTRTFPAHPAAVMEQIGPRRVGGVYRSGYWEKEYTVLDVEPAAFDMPWAITVLFEDGIRRRHHTAWNARDSIVCQPSDIAAAPTIHGYP
ncbi:hypothetical protein ACL02S_23490 [Nocardia sp. 004]|uniref:hypothetical protein n=1 Tax=Nocardia sp. 004 TaxID=3385978 RepID=UPI0039A09B81